jgi:hypothetical protein
MSVHDMTLKYNKRDMRKVMKMRWERSWKKNGVTFFKVLSQQSHKGTEENHETLFELPHQSNTERSAFRTEVICVTPEKNLLGTPLLVWTSQTSKHIHTSPLHLVTFAFVSGRWHW